MKVTLMADIPLRAKIRRKEITRGLQIRNAQSHGLASEGHPRALP